MNDQPLISVVIPFFNAEGCVDQCLDLVLAQTYPRYEVLCVDDGSTDGTAARLDAYAEDPQVKVFHISNGGPGAARNYGVAQAAGEWIAFVDGDDLASPYYLESLMEAQQQTGVDMVVGHLDIVGAQESVRKQRFAKAHVERVLSREDAATELLYQKVTESPCAKLIKKEDLVACPFPGGWYEDVAVAGRLYLRMNSVAVLDAPIYAYVMSDGSVTHRHEVPAEEICDFVRATDDMVSSIEAAYPQLHNAAVYRRMLQTARLYKLVCNAGAGADEEAGTDKAAVVNQMRELLAAFRPDDEADSKQMMRFRLLAMCPPLYRPLFALYDRAKKGVGR